MMCDDEAVDTLHFFVGLMMVGFALVILMVGVMAILDWVRAHA